MLSRRPNYDQGEKDNQNIVILPEDMFIKWGTISYIPEEPPQQDEGIIRQWAGTHDLKKVNGEWWKETCKVITREEPEKRKIIQAYHNIPAYGHPGISWTKCYISIGLHSTGRYIGLPCSYFLSFFLTPKPMYNTI